MAGHRLGALEGGEGPPPFPALCCFGSLLGVPRIAGAVMMPVARAQGAHTLVGVPDTGPPGGTATRVPLPRPFPPALPRPRVAAGECTCSCIPNDKENMRHLSPLGVCFTLVFTYAGFVLLAIGTLWNASIVSKLGEIRRQWRALQGVEMGVGAQPPRAPYDPLPAAPMDTAVVDFKCVCATSVEWTISFIKGSRP